MKGLPERITNEYLNSLPKIQLTPTGDIRTYARYDKDRGIVYLLDATGCFNGKYTRADDLDKYRFENKEASDTSDAAETPKEKPEGDTEKADETTEQSPEGEPEGKPNGEQEPDAEPETDQAQNQEENKEGTKKKWVKPALCIAAVVAVIAVLFTLGKAARIVHKQKKAEQPVKETSVSATENNQEDPAALQDPDGTTIAAQESAEQTVAVLATTGDLLPGHILSEQDIQVEALSEIEYRILAGMNGYYIQEDLETILGQAVVAYLPAGSYLTYTNIAADYSPANPWSRTEERPSLVKLQVSVSADNWTHHLWGTEADIRIEAQTKISTANEPPVESELPPGIKYSNSTVESMVMDTYEIQNAVITDVLDAKGNSLFARYCALTQIPSGYLSRKLDELYATTDALDTLKPVTIVIALPTEEATLISGLKADKLTVAVMDPMPEANTVLQSDTYNEMQNIGKALASQWKQIS